MRFVTGAFALVLVACSGADPGTVGGAAAPSTTGPDQQASPDVLSDGGAGIDASGQAHDADAPAAHHDAGPAEHDAAPIQDAGQVLSDTCCTTTPTVPGGGMACGRSNLIAMCAASSDPAPSTATCEELQARYASGQCPSAQTYPTDAGSCCVYGTFQGTICGIDRLAGECVSPGGLLNSAIALDGGESCEQLQAMFGAGTCR